MSGAKTGLRYKRVLLKLSGEALMGKNAYGIDMGVCNRLALDVKEVVEAGAQIALVIGGGFRLADQVLGPRGTFLRVACTR